MYSHDLLIIINSFLFPFLASPSASQFEKPTHACSPLNHQVALHAQRGHDPANLWSGFSLSSQGYYGDSWLTPCGFQTLIPNTTLTRKYDTVKGMQLETRCPSQMSYIPSGRSDKIQHLDTHYLPRKSCKTSPSTVQRTSRYLVKFEMILG